MKKIALLIISIFILSISLAQKGKLIDGTIGTIGSKLILHSEVEAQLLQAKQEGFDEGKVEGFDEGEVRLFIPAPEKGDEDILIGLDINAIGDARLVMTDELLKAAGVRAKAGEVSDGADWTEENEAESNDIKAE